MIHLFALIKGDVEIEEKKALIALKRIVLGDRNLFHYDVCFAVVTSFPYASTRRFEDSAGTLYRALATISELSEWTRAKFFQDFQQATELQRWDNYLLTVTEMIGGTPVHFTIVGTDSDYRGAYVNSVEMSAGPFHWFCQKNHEPNDRLVTTKLNEPEKPVCVVPQPDPLPPKQTVSYPGEDEVVRHVVAPTTPEQPAITVDLDWVDRLIELFKGKGKKNG